MPDSSSGPSQDRPPEERPPDLLEVLKQGWQALSSLASKYEPEFRAWGRDVRARAGRKDDSWRWLLSRVSSTTALSIIGGLEAERRIVEEKRKRGAVVTLLLDDIVDGELTSEMRRALAGAPLHDQQGDQLRAALDFVDAGEHHLAGPLLINTLEGIFWFEGERLGLIERNDKGKWAQTALAPKPGKQVDGIEEALKLCGRDIDEDFRRFVTAVVYGDQGDPCRHGTPPAGWQLRASLLVFALIGWLEWRGLTESDAAIRAACQRVQERREQDRRRRSDELSEESDPPDEGRAGGPRAS
jgi:hypothetical protein